MHSPTHLRGEAMIISVLILSAVMLSFSLVGMNSVVRHMQTNSSSENKKIAVQAATACLEIALDRLGRNASYTGNENISIDNLTCTIRPITVGVGTWTISSEGRSNNQYARYTVILSNRAPITISSWREVATF